MQRPKNLFLSVMIAISSILGVIAYIVVTRMLQQDRELEAAVAVQAALEDAGRVADKTAAAQAQTYEERAAVQQRIIADQERKLGQATAPSTVTTTMTKSVPTTVTTKVPVAGKTTTTTSKPTKTTKTS